MPTPTGDLTITYINLDNTTGVITAPRGQIRLSPSGVEFTDFTTWTFQPWSRIDRITSDEAISSYIQ
jgi:hypothetical protein